MSLCSVHIKSFHKLVYIILPPVILYILSLFDVENNYTNTIPSKYDILHSDLYTLSFAL